MSRRFRIVALCVAAALAAFGITWWNLGGPDRTSGALVTPSSKPPTTTAPSTTTDPPTTTTTAAPVWRVVWGSAMAWGYGVADNTTVRDLLTVPTGGQAIRFRISNVFGNAPLVIGAATVADSTGASNVDAATIHPLTFNGSPTTTIAPGTLTYTDPVYEQVQAGQALAVSLWVDGADLVSVHPCCTAPDDYFTANNSGNHTAAPTLAGISTPSPWERFVDAADVLQTTGKPSIVVLGDSITDGFNSTERWTDLLQDRIGTLPPSERPAVVNEGITANALTSVVHTDDLVGGGPSGLSRFQQDVISQPGVSQVIVLLGTNDLWFGATADEVIQGYQTLIAQAHAAGLRIIGMTLLPRSSSAKEIWTPVEQQYLETVDQWIRTSGKFDAVIDIAKAVADTYNGQCNPNAMFPPYDSGDNLHPNAAGQRAMANFIDPSVLGLPSMGLVTPLVHVTPTPNCAA